MILFNRKPGFGGFFRTDSGMLMIHPTTTEGTVFYNGFDARGSLLFTGTCAGGDIGEVCDTIAKKHSCGVHDCIAPFKTPRYREVQKAIGRPELMALVLRTEDPIPKKPKYKASLPKRIRVKPKPIPVPQNGHLIPLSSTEWTYTNGDFPQHTARITYIEPDGFYYSYLDATGKKVSGLYDKEFTPGNLIEVESLLTSRFIREFSEGWTLPGNVLSGEDLKDLCSYADYARSDWIPVNRKKVEFVDPSHIAITRIETKGDNSVFGLNTEGEPLEVNISDICKTVDPKAFYKVRKECDRNGCRLVLESKGDRTSYELRGFEERRPFTDLEFDNGTTLDPEELRYAAGQAAAINKEELILENDGKDLYLGAMNDTARMHVDIGDSISGKSKSAYPIDYVSGAAKCMKKNDSVRFSSGDDYPLRLQYARPRYDVTHLIAPRINEEGPR